MPLDRRTVSRHPGGIQVIGSLSKETAMGDVDHEECFGEMIDGRWETTGCQCEDCRQFEDDQIEHAVEDGRISDDQARAMHHANDQARALTGVFDGAAR